MKLLVFDIDGTLTHTDYSGEHYYLQAFERCFGYGISNTDWNSYAHVTDSYITEAVVKQAEQRTPTRQEIGNLQQTFVALLQEAVRRDERRIRAVPGAQEFVRHLLARGEWDVALATGGWKISAQFKLHAAGLAASSVPGAYADDGYSRAEIVRMACLRAQAKYRRAQYERVVSIGDGVWDVATARELGVPFLGIDSTGDGAQLRSAGASHVVRDYCDISAVLDSVVKAAVPR